MREIFQTLGANIRWNDSSRSVTAKVNGNDLLLDSAPILYNTPNYGIGVMCIDDSATTVNWKAVPNSATVSWHSGNLRLTNQTALAAVVWCENVDIKNSQPIYYSAWSKTPYNSTPN